MNNFSEKSRIEPSNYDWLAAVICILTSLFWFNILSYKYYHFGYYDWDLALFSHAMWSLSEGSFTSSLFGMNFLGNHANYIAIILVPIFKLFQHPLTLIALKILSFTSGMFILHVLTKEKFPGLISIIFILLYATFPPNIFMLLHEFQFENLAVGLLFLLYYFFQKKKFLPFLLTAVVLTLVKENMPPIVMAFGIYIFFSKREEKMKWGISTLALGIGMFLISILIVIPAIRADFSIEHSIYTQMYPVFKHSGDTFFISTSNKLAGLIKSIFIPMNFVYIRDLFGPLIYVAIFSPHIIFLISPIIFQNLLTSTFTMKTIYYHYGATIVPFIFLASIHSLSFIRSKTRPVIFHTVMATLVALCLYNSYSYSYKIQERVKNWNDRLDPLRAQLIEIIPHDAPVIATFEFLDHLTMRKHLYPFYSVLKGKNYFTGQSPYIVPDHVQYALLDLNDPWLRSDMRRNPKAVGKRMKQFFLNEGWRIHTAVEHLILLDKNAENGIKLLDVSRAPFDETTRKVNLSINHDIRLIAAKINKFLDQNSRRIPITFYWEKLGHSANDYGMIIYLTQENKPVLKTTRTIGYSIYPTSQWTKGTYVKEHYELLLPALRQGKYSLKMVFFNEKNSSIAKLNMHGNDTAGSRNTFVAGLILID